MRSQLLTSYTRASKDYDQMPPRHFITRRNNFTGCDTINNCGDGFFPPLQLLVIADEGSTANVLHRTIEIPATTCKFLQDFAWHRNSKVLRSPSFSAISRVSSPFRSVIHIHNSAVNRILCHSFVTWPTTYVGSEEEAVLMPAKCSSIFLPALL